MGRGKGLMVARCLEVKGGIYDDNMWEALFSLVQMGGYSMYGGWKKSEGAFVLYL